MLLPSDRPAKYVEVGLIVPTKIQESVCDFIIGNYASGLILEDEEDSGLIGIKFYHTRLDDINIGKELTQFIRSIDPKNDFAEKNIKKKLVPEKEWVKAYKDSIKPINIDEVVIRPPWIKSENSDKIELIIEPKMAFGTGHHETTSLCIGAILKHLKAGDSFFDLGCGSGILSILAAKIGAARIIGTDIDPIAVENARDNIIQNNVADRIEIKIGSIENAEDDEPYDFLVANIIKETIMDLCERMLGCVESGGIMILSGLLAADEKYVSQMLDKIGNLKYEMTKEGQWLAYTVFK